MEVVAFELSAALLRWCLHRGKVFLLFFSCRRHTSFIEVLMLVLLGRAIF